MKLVNACLLVNKFGACFSFYQDVWGLTVLHGDANDNYAGFDTGGGSKLTLFKRDVMAEVLGIQARPSHITQQDPSVLEFEVEDIQAAFARSQGRGAEVALPVTRKDEWGIWVAYFRDPDGNLVEIFERLPQD